MSSNFIFVMKVDQWYLLEVKNSLTQCHADILWHPIFYDNEIENFFLVYRFLMGWGRGSDHLYQFWSKQVYSYFMQYFNTTTLKCIPLHCKFEKRIPLLYAGQLIHKMFLFVISRTQLIPWGVMPNIRDECLTKLFSLFAQVESLSIPRKYKHASRLSLIRLETDFIIDIIIAYFITGFVESELSFHLSFFLLTDLYTSCTSLYLNLNFSPFGSFKCLTSYFAVFSTLFLCSHEWLSTRS